MLITLDSNEDAQRRGTELPLKPILKAHNDVYVDTEPMEFGDAKHEGISQAQKVVTIGYEFKYVPYDLVGSILDNRKLMTFPTWYSLGIFLKSHQIQIS